MYAKIIDFFKIYYYFCELIKNEQNDIIYYYGLQNQSGHLRGMWNLPG